MVNRSSSSCLSPRFPETCLSPRFPERVQRLPQERVMPAPRFAQQRTKSAIEDHVREELRLREAVAQIVAEISDERHTRLAFEEQLRDEVRETTAQTVEEQYTNAEMLDLLRHVHARMEKLETKL